MHRTDFASWGFGLPTQAQQATAPWRLLRETLTRWGNGIRSLSALGDSHAVEDVTRDDPWRNIIVTPDIRDRSTGKVAASVMQPKQSTFSAVKQIPFTDGGSTTTCIVVNVHNKKNTHFKCPTHFSMLGACYAPREGCSYIGFYFTCEIVAVEWTFAKKSDKNGAVSVCHEAAWQITAYFLNSLTGTKILMRRCAFELKSRGFFSSSASFVYSFSRIQYGSEEQSLKL